jgi:hypothetical protein
MRTPWTSRSSTSKGEPAADISSWWALSIDMAGKPAGNVALSEVVIRRF